MSAVPAQIDPPPGLTVANAPHPLLASDEVRYVGQPVARVVGESRAAAEDAAERVEVDYEPLEAVEDPRASTETLARWEKREGDVDGAFAAAAHVVRTDHVIPRLVAVPMEPRGAIALPGERLTVWSSSQSAHRSRAQLAQMLRPPGGLDPRDRARTSAAASAPRARWAVETPLVALAAETLGRPVKWAEDRRENFLAAPQGRGQRAAVELALDGDGRDPRAARADPRRPRRLPAAEHRDPAAHDRDAARRLLRHPGRRGLRDRRAHQQGADGPVPRRRAAGGDLPDRDDARRRRARARDRPGSSCAGAISCARSRTGPRSAGRTTRATSSAAWTRRCGTPGPTVAGRRFTRITAPAWTSAPPERAGRLVGEAPPGPARRRASARASRSASSARAGCSSTRRSRATARTSSSASARRRPGRATRRCSRRSPPSGSTWTSERVTVRVGDTDALAGRRRLVREPLDGDGRLGGRRRRRRPARRRAGRRPASSPSRSSPPAPTWRWSRSSARPASCACGELVAVDDAGRIVNPLLAEGQVDRRRGPGPRRGADRGGRPDLPARLRPADGGRDPGVRDRVRRVAVAAEPARR